MKILIVSQYFWPENFIINDIAIELSEQGHEVVVATGKPNYPDGKIYEGYHASGLGRERYRGRVEVLRVPLRPRGKGGAFNLILNYLSFVFSGIFYFPSLFRGRQFDTILVFGMSPITMAIPAILLKWKLKCHLAVWVQDLWPESLSATGFIRNRLLLKMVGWMVRGIYAFSDTLLVQSKAFQEAVGRYSRAEKIVYYPNSYKDVDQPSADSTLVPVDLLTTLEENFCVVFAGNFGLAQSVETLARAAEKIRHLTGCKMVLVGSGSMLHWLQEEKAKKSLDNVVFAGRFPPEEMPHFFSRAAGLLVTLKREEIFSYTVPSKVQAYLASGRPIIAALDGEGARIVEEAGAGLTCPAEDAEGLARCIERLYRMSPREREMLGMSGRKYFLEHFEMERQCDRLVGILEQRIDGEGGLVI